MLPSCRPGLRRRRRPGPNLSLNHSRPTAVAARERSIFHHPPESFTPSAFSTGVVIPVIDLSGSRPDVIGAVKAAAETLGLFLVVNHGVPEAIMSEMLAAVRQFNEETAEAKAPYYTRDQGRRVGYNCNADLFQSPARWRDTMHVDDPDQIPRRSSAGVQGRHVRVRVPGPDLTLGAIRHSDPSFLTVLLRDSAVGGLQMLVDDLGDSKSAAWVEVPAVAGALEVNVGDFLQVASNDRFKSVVHRVVSNSVGPQCLWHASSWRRTPRCAPGGRRRGWSAALQERHGGGAIPLI
ncbi:hypothetical protein ZWY2020_044534 [Hordeum vulgare]|nr:hypothetical protein ZWY2020_044534 [Hordeum vulgare]